MRTLSFIFVLLAFSPLTAVAGPSCDDLLANPNAKVPISKIVDIYRTLVTGIGASHVSNEDILRLYQGGQKSLEKAFELHENGKTSEYHLIRDGLLKLKAYAVSQISDRETLTQSVLGFLQGILGERHADVVQLEKAIVRRDRLFEVTAFLQEEGMKWATSVAVSPDSNFIAAGAYDQIVRIWDIREHKISTRTPEAGGTIYSVAFSPDSQLIAMGTSKGYFQVSNIKSGKTVLENTNPDASVERVEFSPTNNILAVSADPRNRKIDFWDLSMKQILRTLSIDVGSFTSFRFSSDGRYLVSSGTAEGAAVWHVATGKRARSFTKFSRTLKSIAMSPDGKTIVGGSSDGSVHIWRGKKVTHRQIFDDHILPEDNRFAINAVTFSSDGKYFLTVSEDCKLVLWNTETGQPVRKSENEKLSFKDVAFSPDGNYFVAATEDATHRKEAGLKLWDLEAFVAGE